MKHFVFLLTMSLSATLIGFSSDTGVKDWSLYSTENAVYAKSRGKKYKLELSGGDPKLLKWESSPQKGVSLLIYHSGYAGKDAGTAIQRAKVIRTKDMKELLDFPWKYEPLKTPPDPVQPKWTWKKHQLVVKDLDSGEKTISIK